MGAGRRPPYPTALRGRTPCVQLPAPWRSPPSPDPQKGGGARGIPCHTGKRSKRDRINLGGGVTRSVLLGSPTAPGPMGAGHSRRRSPGRLRGPVNSAPAASPRPLHRSARPPGAATREAARDRRRRTACVCRSPRQGPRPPGPQCAPGRGGGQRRRARRRQKRGRYAARGAPAHQSAKGRRGGVGGNAAAAPRHTASIGGQCTALKDRPPPPITPTP